MEVIMSYSRFMQFLNDHRPLQFVWLALCWVANYYGIFWLVSWIKPAWVTENFDFWLGLVCLVGCLIGCVALTRCWRIQDALGLRNGWLTDGSD